MMDGVKEMFRRYWQLAFSCVVFLFMVLVLGSALAPFEPYHLYSYEVRPSETCTREPVRVWLNYKVDEVPLGSVSSVTVDAVWVERDTGLVVEEPVAEYPIQEGIPRGTRRSDLYREAPAVPGEWEFWERNLSVNGWLAVWPHEHHISARNREYITVKEC